MDKTLYSPPSEHVPDGNEAPSSAQARTARGERLRVALRGIKLGVHRHSSFSVYFFFGTVILAAGLVLHCGPVEWCLLLGCMALVLIVELFQSAIETVVQGQERTTKNHVRSAREISAGAVVISRVAAALISSIIVLSRLAEFLPWHGDM